jgi:ribosomal-protein-alanine N-acetyltransferase
MQIREAVESDMPAIASLEAEVYSVEPGWSLEDYESDFKTEGRYYLVAEDNGLIGYAACLVEEQIGELIVNTVKPEYRGKGLGQQLLEKRIEWLSDKATEVYATVRPDNQASRNLLEKAGFTLCDEMKDYYGEGKDGVEYVLRIGTIS